MPKSTPINEELSQELLEAVLENDEEQVQQLLLLDDVDVNVQGMSGSTPLHYAIGCEEESECVNLLLASRNIDVNIKEKFGNTPLHLACLYKDLESIELLLQMPNIDVFICNNDLKTPLDILKEKYYEEEKMAYETIEFQEKYIQLMSMLENFKPVTHQLSPENQEKLGNLSPNDIKMPENKAFLDECARKAGLPQIFMGLSHKQQSALLDVYATEIRANDAYSESIGQIVYATHKVEKEAKRQASAGQIKEALCQNQR